MFQKFKTIDQAFQKVRLISALSVIASALICLWVIYNSYAKSERDQGRIYIMVNGSVFQAVAANERDYIKIDARNHVKDFHELLFNLDPDEKMIRDNMNKAFYLADGSAKKFYDNLKESGYITSLISANIIERVRIDSISLYAENDPYAFQFRCWAKETLTRSSSLTTRSLVTGGYLRKIQRSDDNSHGFMIEQFEVLENRNLETKNR